MKRGAFNLVPIIILLAMVVIIIVYFNYSKKEVEMARLNIKSTFGKEGKDLGEFSFERFISLAIKDDYLFVADSGNNRIQILKISPDGNLSPKSTFGKEGRGLGEFGNFLITFAIKDRYLYIADASNNRIQIMEIK